MKIGVFTGPTFRPHPEHVAWLAQLARADGHHVVGLSCDGAVPDCYARALLGRGRTGCIPCSLAGLRAYGGIEIHSARSIAAGTVTDGWRDAEVLSSVRTILREEDDRRLSESPATELIARLAPAAARMYSMFHEWIGREKLDAALIYNGRMDITRAAMRAAQQRGIRFATVERASFDTGIRVLPMTDCNSPRNEQHMQARFRELPLLHEQAVLAADFIARRVKRMPMSEWRSYNPDRQHSDWPHGGSGARVLVGPSSQYEVRGEEGWEALGDMRDAVDSVVARLGKDVSVVVRGHPVWSETIAGASGKSAADYYREWCRRRNYAFIEPESKADTRSLMLQSDLVLATGGTIGIEAACAGRAVLALAPCYYRSSGAVGDAVEASMVEAALAIREVPSRERIRRALRAIYTHAYRTTQYCRFARPVPGTQGTEWQYRADASFSQIERALVSGFTEPDDERTDADTAAEDGVVDWLWGDRWDEIVEAADRVRNSMATGTWEGLRISLPARVLLSIRGQLPKGDRLRNVRR